MIHVRVVGVTAVQAGLVKSDLSGKPSLPLVAADRNRTVEAVKVVLYVRVGFLFSEVGQRLNEGPFVVAP